MGKFGWMPGWLRSGLRVRLARRCPAAPAARRPLLGGLGLLGMAAAGWSGIGLWPRPGRAAPVPPAAPGDAAAARARVEQYQAESSLSRTRAVRRAPRVDWGDALPPFKTVAGDRTLDLPAPRHESRLARVLDAAALGDLLWHTAGVSLEHGGIHYRAAPSAGALFATELYVAIRQVAGVGPGLWHYGAQAHRLQRLDAASPAAAAIGRPGAPWPDGAAAALVATAVLRRTGRKYGDRAYRCMLADLGHALENLRAAAAALGLALQLQPRFDGAAAAAALRIDEAEEGVLMVALLGDAAAVSPAWVPPVRGWQPAAPLPAGTTARLGITDAVHRATSLRWAGEAGAAAGSAALPRRSADARARATAGAKPAALPRAGSRRLPPPALPRQADTLALIAQRRSRRRFSRAPLAPADIGAVLAAMMAAPPQLSAAVRVDLLSLRVAGLAAGAWRYRSDGHALQPLPVTGEELRLRARAAALDQDVVGDAAAVLLLSIDRPALAADPDGFARAWRHAFLEVGLAGERAYLEAGARGLAVCAVGAFHDDEAARLVAADPAREWVAHFVALGLPG